MTTRTEPLAPSTSAHSASASSAPSTRVCSSPASDSPRWTSPSTTTTRGCRPRRRTTSTPTRATSTSTTPAASERAPAATSRPRSSSNTYWSVRWTRHWTTTSPRWPNSSRRATKQVPANCSSISASPTSRWARATSSPPPSTISKPRWRHSSPKTDTKFPASPKNSCCCSRQRRTQWDLTRRSPSRRRCCDGRSRDAVSTASTSTPSPWSSHEFPSGSTRSCAGCRCPAWTTTSCAPTASPVSGPSRRPSTCWCPDARVR
uniref:Unannotated protein n=1 Tax=freshwater metagenome TaxID=449393 RepID=A0A6J7N5T9_9ZZZZ